ncbi:MAG: hypothetical protein WBG50_06010 [Desulfomonilaceae bacterium]
MNVLHKSVEADGTEVFEFNHYVDGSEPRSQAVIMENAMQRANEEEIREAVRKLAQKGSVTFRGGANEALAAGTLPRVR